MTSLDTYQPKARITVLLGGVTGERNVSIASGAQVAFALRTFGYEVVCIDTAKGPLDEESERDLFQTVAGDRPPERDQLPSKDRAVELITHSDAIKNSDVVFNALHGGIGEDGTIQAVLEASGIPFTGSPHLGTTLAMHKDIAKQIFRHEDIATPDWQLVSSANAVDQTRIELPVVVKPNLGGSTLGLTVVRREEDIPAAINLALEQGSEVLIERLVAGTEFTLGVFDGKGLGVGQITLLGPEVFDYRSKYEPGAAIETFPAIIPLALERELQRLAVKAHQALRLGSYSRADFIRDDAGKLWCLEVNVLPGLTANSLMPQSARAGNISFEELCDGIVQAAINQAQDSSSKLTRLPID